MDEETLFVSYLNPHPLLVPTIVRNILSECSYSELKNFRHVCNAWEYEASSILKEKTQIRFPSEDHVSRYITDLEENFCCQSYEFGSDIPVSSPSMQTFFDLFGHYVKALKLHQVQWSGPELWSILSTKLPILEELSVRIFLPRERNDFLPKEGCILHTIRILKLNFSIEKPFKPTPPPPFEVVCPTMLKELLLSMPNIEEIYCPSWPTYVRPDKVVSGLFYNVIFQYPEIQLKNLSRIHINATLDNVQLFNLMEKNFPLRELRLELNPDVKPWSFYFLLKSLENTLQTLVLIFHPDYESENFDDFPILKNLTYLSLHKYCGPISAIVRYLPNLTTLLLNDSYASDDEVMLAEGGNGPEEPRFRLSKLEELIIEGFTYSPCGQLKALARSFPNLKKLNVQHVDDEMLHVICGRLLYLEELDADGKFTDAGVSGIPLDICQNIFQVPDVEGVRCYPYIGQLRRLRGLTLKSWNMSYLSVLLGVNDCKKLKYKRLISPHIHLNHAPMSL